MDIKLVRDLANKIEALPKSKFAMDSFMQTLAVALDLAGFSYEIAGKHEELIKSCGTHGCIAGWAVAFYGDPNLMSHASVEAEGARLLGLSDLEAYNLFYGRWTVDHDTALDKITQEQAVAYLRHCADLGYVPNPNFSTTDEMLRS